MTLYRYRVAAMIHVLALSGCMVGGAAGDGEAQIIGGLPEAGYPAVGSLMFDGQSGCTGTLVTPDAVLTAGHCLQGVTADQVTFAVGPDVTGTAQGYPVASLAVHPQYQDGGEAGPTYDIAVMRLAEPAAEQPMAFNADDATGFAGRPVLLVGYGLTARPSEGGDATGVKHSVEIPIQGVSEQFLDFTIVEGKTGCFGDSGGPALLDLGAGPAVVGVTSWGDTDCNGEFHYTRTDAFADFVAQAIAGEGGEQPPDQVPPDQQPPGGGEGDICQEQGWYGDGICDDCPQPDPDCY